MAIDAATLDAQVEALEGRLRDDASLNLEAIEELQFQVGELKYQAHQVRTKHQRRRCAQCGCYLRATPSEQRYSVDGDNLDIYVCTRCGEALEECY